MLGACIAPGTTRPLPNRIGGTGGASSSAAGSAPSSTRSRSIDRTASGCFSATASLRVVTIIMTTTASITSITTTATTAATTSSCRWRGSTTRASQHSCLHLGEGTEQARMEVGHRALLSALTLLPDPAGHSSRFAGQRNHFACSRIDSAGRAPSSFGRKHRRRCSSSRSRSNCRHRRCWRERSSTDS